MKKVDGFWYPDSEERLHRNHSSLWSLEQHILPYCDRREACVQAGGAVGAWPITYAKHFDSVTTFEPNPALYECFRRNLAEYTPGNVHLYYAGLSNKEGNCEMVDVQSNNMGAWHIAEGGETPMWKLDRLELPACDLLQLDVEGGEIDALEGAEETIREHRPVIVVESKPNVLKHFGRTVEELHSAILKHNYRLEHRFCRDDLWLPN